MTTPSHSQLGGSFGLTWALATFVGSIAGLFMGAVYFPLGWVIGFLSMAGIDTVLPNEKFVAALSIGIMTGLMIGLLQSLLLRKRIKYAVWWILAAIIGWAAGFVIIRGPNDGIWIYALSGAISGILQSFVLWRQVNSALSWTVVSLIGWFIGGIFWPFIGPAIAGLITGFGMARLLNGTGQQFAESNSSA